MDINELRSEEWWQGKIKGNSNKLNDEFEYRMLDIHFSKQKVVEIIPNEKVVWLLQIATSAHLGTKANGMEQKSFLISLN